MKVVFSSFAASELENAKQFYDLEFDGGGSSFFAEVEKATMRIAEFPNAWPAEHFDIRKCLLYKFPYKLIYSIEDDHILIISIAHQHREPEYWID